MAEKRFRVVYLDHVAQMSGGEIALLRLLPHLTRVDAHVILGEDGPLADRMRASGVAVEILPLAPRVRTLRKDRVLSPRRLPIGAMVSAGLYSVRLAKRLREIKPDLVHSNSLKSGVYGSVAARLAGVPLVWHVRDRIARDYLPPGAVWLIRAMTRYFAAEVIVNSASTMQTLRRDSEPAIIHSVLPEVLDPQPVSPVRSNSPERPTFGMIGRVAPWKGQHVFLEAFARAFPDGQEQAAFVGRAMFGEDAYEEQLHRLAARLGVADRVEFRGFRENVWAELSGFVVVVHASITDEPFGQVIIEAQAAGKPIVASNGGGPAELITDGVDGRLFEPGDIDGLSAILRELATDPAQRQRLSQAAEVSAEQYRPPRVRDRVYEIYDRACSRASG
jgi:glycosyltransferase involved in cell wall biosynthesis